MPFEWAEAIFPCVLVARSMSDEIDLSTITEVLRDLSIQLSRIHKKEDGESSSAGEPSGPSVASGSGEHRPGAGSEFWRIPDSDLTDPPKVRAASVGDRGGGRGDSTGASSSYREAVRGKETVIVTPIKERKPVMSTRSGTVFQPGTPAGTSAGGAAAGVTPAAMAGLTVAQFEAGWNQCTTDAARIAYENNALQHGIADVKVAALVHRDQRQTAAMQNMQTQLTAAQQAAIAAQQAAATAAAAAAAAPPAPAVPMAVDAAAKASPPAKFENKEKDLKIREWIPVVEDYLRNAPNAEYLRMASSYLSGKPRSYWMSQYESYRRNYAGAEPPVPRQFFRETMEHGYGLRDETQSHWDTWNKLHQGPGQSIDEYNVAFEQALVDLNGQINDEAVKIEKYRGGLQVDLKEMCRVSPDGTRWQTLRALVTYATLQWPTIEARLARRRSEKRESRPSGSSPSRVGGKRKITSPQKSRGSAKRVSGLRLTDEEHAENLRTRVCHVCKQPGHQWRECPDRKQRDDGEAGGSARLSSRKGRGGEKPSKSKDF